MRMLKAMIVAFVVVVTSTAPVANAAIHGAAWILIDDQTGAVLSSSGADVPRPPASLTKMVTAQVVVEHARLDDVLRISQSAANAEADRIRWPVGMQFTVSEVLHGLLMESSNGAAIALAEHIAGSQKSFARLMNAKAAALGAHTARFVTPHGLDAPGQGASPRDLAAIARGLLRVPALAEIVRTKSFKLTWQGGLTTFYNSTRFLSQYRGAIGVKPGFTSLAGNCLAAAAERGGHRLVAVVMNSTSVTEDAGELMELGFSKLGVSEAAVAEPSFDEVATPQASPSQESEVPVVRPFVAAPKRRRPVADSRMPSPAGASLVFLVTGLVTVRRRKAKRSA